VHKFVSKSKDCSSNKDFFDDFVVGNSLDRDDEDYDGYDDHISFRALALLCYDITFFSVLAILILTLLYFINAHVPYTIAIVPKSGY